MPQNRPSSGRLAFAARQAVVIRLALEIHDAFRSWHLCSVEPVKKL
jgi:hypothetical protein